MYLLYNTIPDMSLSIIALWPKKPGTLMWGIGGHFFDLDNDDKVKDGTTFGTLVLTVHNLENFLDVGS